MHWKKAARNAAQCTTRAIEGYDALKGKYQAGAAIYNFTRMAAPAFATAAAMI